MSSAYPPNSTIRQLRSLRLDLDYYSPPASPPDDDENASLRSQALNADGTPKRPMNAFMIFARRRRPQVSAANQMMRTGEISKILSREWNTMALSDKQFYLDQAKKLKENFNAKYPDYVYRRRPNNSRKKRRTDAAPYDTTISPHHPHDYDHDEAYGTVSPVDALVAAQGYRLPAPAYSGPPAPGFHTDSSYHTYYSRHGYDSAPPPAPPTLSLSGGSFSGNSGGSHHHHHHHPPHGAHIYNPADDDHPLWPTGGSSGTPPFLPKLEPWSHAAHHPQPHHSTHPHPHLAHPSDPVGHGPPSTLRLSARRGGGPLPLPLSGGGLMAHSRHWSDSTTATTTTGASSASPPSSAGSGGFPASVSGPGAGFGSTSGAAGFGSSSTGAGFGGASPPATFETLTAPFYPGSGAGSTAGSVTSASTASTAGGVGPGSPSTASASSASSYFSAPGNDREREARYERAYGSSSSHHSHGHSSSHGHTSHGHHAGRSDSDPGPGATLGSTLALSPANVQHPSLWSSMRTAKSEL